MNKPLIMGIVNVTPDSFSGDGLWHCDNATSEAIAQAERMVAEGADILDIGGESSRPGSAPVPAEEEIRRVVPVISALAQKKASVILSVDTVKADVAEKALQAGAAIVNDVSAMANDPRMAEVVARYNAKVVLMHNRAKADLVCRDAKVGGQYIAPEYADVIDDVITVLKERVGFAQKAGIAKENIILDPGIGFGKTPDQNMALIAHIGKIKALGFPVLVAPSRKSFIGHVLDASIEERLEGTAACIAVSIFLGADIVRVHEVKFMARTAKMAAALKAQTSPEMKDI